MPQKAEKIVELLISEFENRKILSRQDLFEFYHRIDPQLKETTFRWRIHDLKQRKLITPLGKEGFALGYKAAFIPEVSEKDKKVCAQIARQFPTLKQCVWSTKIINEFMLHMPGRYMTVLEIEQDALEPVFNFLKDTNAKNVFLQPTEKEVRRYISDIETPTILLSLVSKAPVQKINETFTTTLEKLIVDLFCDRILFTAYHGDELVHIINNAYEQYAIDFTKLFSYAKRRRKEADLKNYLLNKTNIPQGILQ